MLPEIKKIRHVFWEVSIDKRKFIFEKRNMAFQKIRYFQDIHLKVNPEEGAPQPTLRDFSLETILVYA
jgi:hypothetical protein